MTQASRTPAIRVVSYDWLLSSVNSHQKLDETQFAMLESDQVTPQISAASESMKRARSKTPVNDGPLETKESFQRPPSKKFKETQKARTRGLHVSVDETCTLAGEQFSCATFMTSRLTRSARYSQSLY